MPGKDRYPRTKFEIDQDFREMSKKIDNMMNDDFDVIKNIVKQSEKEKMDNALSDQF